MGYVPPPAPMRKLEKTKWTPEEDEALKNAVYHHDAKNWKSISSYLPGKSEVQCLHRYDIYICVCLCVCVFSLHTLLLSCY